jgi:F0F1-type ATP synthase alpha subunit
MYALLYAANKGTFDSVPIDKIALACENLLDELAKKYPKITERVNSGDKVSDSDNAVIQKIAEMVADSYQEKATTEKGGKTSK